MRVIASISTVVLLLVSNWTSYGAQLSGLFVGYGPEAYFSDSYTAKSPQDTLFFEGEPILFRVSVRNMNPVDTTLAVASTDPRQLLSIKAFRAPALPPESTKQRRWSVDRFDDEEDFVLPITVAPPVKAWEGGTYDLKLEPSTKLGPGESVEWVLSVRSQGLQPGYYYRFVVKVNGTEDGKKLLQDFTTIGFELRANTNDAQPEILRREAFRRFFKNDFVGARQAANALLKIHPNSYDAYRALEMIADGEGQREEAAKHRAAAESIERAQRDELLLKFNPRPPVRGR